MKNEIELIIRKQKAGGEISSQEIRSLMIYALDLLKEIESHTKASINRAHKLIGEKFKIAA